MDGKFGTNIQQIMARMGAVDSGTPNSFEGMTYSPEEVRTAENQAIHDQLVNKGATEFPAADEAAARNMKQAARVGANMFEAFRDPSAAEQLAATRTSVLKTVNLSDPDSLKIGAKKLMDLGDVKGAFAMANRAGRMLDAQSKRAYQKAETEKAAAEARNLDKKTRAALGDFEETLDAIPDAVMSPNEKAKFRERWLNAKIKAQQNAGRSSTVPTGGAPTEQEKTQVDVFLENQEGFTASDFKDKDNHKLFSDAIASKAKAWIKDKKVKDYNVALQKAFDEEKGKVTNEQGPVDILGLGYFGSGAVYHPKGSEAAPNEPAKSSEQNKVDLDLSAPTQ